MKEKGVFSSAVEGTKTLTGAVVADIGKASPATLCEPTEKHASKTYKVISDHFTFNDTAKTFSEALEKEVTYKYEPFNRQAKLARTQISLLQLNKKSILKLYDMNVGSGSVCLWKTLRF